MPRNLRSLQNCQQATTQRSCAVLNRTTGVALVEVYDLSPNTDSILGNISSRSFVQTDDNVMIGGFIVQGSGPTKIVVVRAIGPELTQYGVPNVLVNPTLELHDGTGGLIASNDDWHDYNNQRDYHQRPSGRDIRNSGHAPTDGREWAIMAICQQEIILRSSVV